MSEHGTLGDTRLPPEKQSRVDAELDTGEQLLWVGEPSPGRFMRMSLPILLVGIPFFGFALFWVVMASGMGFLAIGGDQDLTGPGVFGLFACFPLCGLPFLLIGLAMLTSPFWMARLARKTFYAVTDRRAILWSAGWWGSVTVRSFRPGDMTELQRVEFADGSGDLIFREFYTWSPGSHNHAGHYHGGHYQRNRLGFFGIERVRDVEAIIRRVVLEAGKSRGDG
jgi:hypothetical protein